MSKKRQGDCRPKKLTAYFQRPAEEQRHDHAAPSISPLPQRNHYSDLPDADDSPDHSPQRHKTPPNSSPGSSPVKSKRRMDPDLNNRETSDRTTAVIQQQEHESPIAHYPTSNQPVLDTQLKDMLLTLHRSLQADFNIMTHKFSQELSIIGDRVDKVEEAVTDITTTVNAIIDRNEREDEDNQYLQAKIADLEDRSRRNNLKLRGVPETVATQDLTKFANELFLSLIPELTPLKLTIDRIHRLPKPSFLPPDIPRDVLMRIHFFSTKESILQKARSLGTLPDPYAKIQIYADLSKYTLDLRRQLNTVTKALRNHQIPYKWKHPTRLSIEKDGSVFLISTLEKGIALLKDWNIVPDSDSTINTRTQQGRISPQWHKVTSSRKDSRR